MSVDDERSDKKNTGFAGRKILENHADKDIQYPHRWRRGDDGGDEPLSARQQGYRSKLFVHKIQISF